MKTSVMYISDEVMHSSGHFLSKEELRRIFGAGVTISRTVTYRRKRMRKGHSKDGRAAVKSGYPIFRQKSREIEPGRCEIRHFHFAKSLWRERRGTGRIFFLGTLGMFRNPKIQLTKGEKNEREKVVNRRRR
jgi:hypothetical protein